MGKPIEQMDIRRAFSTTVRRLRARKGLAQEALAYAADVDRGYMGALERGRSTPTLDIVFRLLPHLEVDFVQFAVEFQASLKRGRKPS
jgi:transcriptional regulator with XRE-family HTH domain